MIDEHLLAIVDQGRKRRPATDAGCQPKMATARQVNFQIVTLLATASLWLSLCIIGVRGHGFLVGARGTLSGSGNTFKMGVIDSKCPTDYCPQCQNGGFLQFHHDQDVWRPYAPMDRTTPMRRRFGMCGDKDESMNAPHMKSGYFSEECEGYPVLSGLKPGSVINLQMQSTAHHQGFFEFFLCDTTTCGGDMSRSCFETNQCVALERQPHGSCESGNDVECGPIDKNYSNRWYIGCPQYPFLWGGTSEMTEDQTLGGSNGKMAYKIPNDFSCGDACVLQAYWATANVCNPPGLKDYFDYQYSIGNLGNWKGCKGDGATAGGYSPDYDLCGEKEKFPEEFWNCMDISMSGDRFNRHDYNPYYVSGNNGTKKY